MSMWRIALYHRRQCQHGSKPQCMVGALQLASPRPRKLSLPIFELEKYNSPSLLVLDFRMTQWWIIAEMLVSYILSHYYRVILTASSHQCIWLPAEILQDLPWSCEVREIFPKNVTSHKGGYARNQFIVASGSYGGVNILKLSFEEVKELILLYTI